MLMIVRRLKLNLTVILHDHRISFLLYIFIPSIIIVNISCVDSTYTYDDLLIPAQNVISRDELVIWDNVVDHTINEFYENTPLIFIGYVISVDSMYLQVRPIRMIKGDIPISDSLLIQVPYYRRDHNIHESTAGESHYINPFQENLVYLFFIEDQLITLYGYVGDGYYYLSILEHPLNYDIFHRISPELLNEDDLNRVIEGQVPLLDEYSYEGTVYFPASNDSFRLDFQEQDGQLSISSNIPEINELVASVSVLTGLPLHRNFSYGRNSNSVRIRLRPQDYTNRNSHEEIRLLGDLTRYVDGILHFRAQPYMPFVADLKELVRWADTWRMPSTIILINLEIDSDIEYLNGESQLLFRINSEDIETAIDTMEARYYCSDGHYLWDGILGKDTLALIVTPDDEFLRDLYGYLVLDLNYIPQGFRGHILYNLYTELLQSDSVSSTLYSMEDEYSNPTRIGSYNASLVSSFSYTSQWEHTIMEKLRAEHRAWPSQDAPAMICVFDSTIQVIESFSEPINQTNASFDFVSPWNDDSILTPSRITWFTNESSFHTMWCCSLEYNRMNVDSTIYKMDIQVEDLDGNPYAMNSGFYPRLSLVSQPTGDTAVVNIMFASKMDPNRTEISLIPNDSLPFIIQPFRTELHGDTIETTNSIYYSNDRIRAFFLLDSLSLMNPQLWIQPVSEWGSVLKLFWVAYLQIDNFPVIPELHIGIPKGILINRHYHHSIYID